MPLIGIIAKKNDVEEIKRELKKDNIEIFKITKESIKNIRNIKFEEIIIMKNINFEKEEYKLINKIISKAQYLILNEDIDIDILSKINIQNPIKLVTFGFNSKSTITISSVTDENIVVCIQRDIEKVNKEMIECQEKQIQVKNIKKIYNNLVIFIIKELHNLI